MGASRGDLPGGSPLLDAFGLSARDRRARSRRNASGRPRLRHSHRETSWLARPDGAPLRRIRRRDGPGSIVLVATAMLVPASDRARGSGEPPGPALADERALAERYAPVVRLVEQPHECGPGEPYEPMDVNALFGQPTVALRGPWNPVRPRQDRPDRRGSRRPVRVPPRLSRERARPGLRLRALGAADHRGDEADRLRARRHRSGSPGQARAPVLALLRLQRLQQPARGRLGDDPARLRRPDVRTRRSRGSRSRSATARTKAPERAAWGDDKLEVVDGTHPVVYPAAGSHANKYTEALYLGSSASAGVGCDDTRGPHDELRPVVKTIPSDPAAAARPSRGSPSRGAGASSSRRSSTARPGPNLKTQWNEPIEWSKSWRERSYAVPDRRRVRHERHGLLLRRRSRPARAVSSACSEARA